MKILKALIYPMIAIISVSILLTACSNQIASLVLSEQKSAQVHRKQLAFYTQDERRFEFDEFTDALTNAKSLNPKHRQTLVFIHGMGPYPEKAFKFEELKSLADVYDSAVVMVHWPAWEGRSILPRQNALQTGRLLEPLWPQIAQARAQQPGRFLLIAHSMGAEVMRSVSQSPQPQVFDEFMLASPETDLAGHAQWLDKLQLSAHKTILLNQDDFMLPYAQSVTKTPRLGLTLEHENGQAERLAQNTHYLVLNDVTNWHSVHISKQPDPVRKLLRMVMLDNRLPPTCTTQNNAQTIQLNMNAESLSCTVH